MGYYFVQQTWKYPHRCGEVLAVPDVEGSGQTNVALRQLNRSPKLVSVSGESTTGQQESGLECCLKCDQQNPPKKSIR